MNQKDERTWGALVHLGGLIGMAISPLAGNIIGALVLWLLKRNDSPFVDKHGKEALNFQITMSFLALALSIFNGIRVGIWSVSRALFHDGHFEGWRYSFTGGLFWIVAVLNIVFSVMAAIRASNGGDYRYPFAIRIVK